MIAALVPVGVFDGTGLVLWLIFAGVLVAGAFRAYFNRGSES